ncbi:uncharacterized protein LOC142979637 [Anticarsia gemmatalis]|uniref:uncharacterized protein LOC142979637 n=1 Tax=Anticarsia gemmatalis TaxID=129554 RepID=UPI003F75D341
MYGFVATTKRFWSLFALVFSLQLCLLEAGYPLDIVTEKGNEPLKARYYTFIPEKPPLIERRKDEILTSLSVKDNIQEKEGDRVRVTKEAVSKSLASALLDIFANVSHVEP